MVHSTSEAGGDALPLPNHLHSGSGSESGPALSNMAGGLKLNPSRTSAARSRASASRAPRWWKIRLFRGMVNDVRRRAPFYWSDWKDAWDYRVVPATVYMYFAKYALSSLLAAENNSGSARMCGTVRMCMSCTSRPPFSCLMPHAHETHPKEKKNTQAPLLSHII